MSGFPCICIMGSLDTNEPSCKSEGQNSVCNNCYEIYTQINVNESNVGDPGSKPEGDCLTYFHPHLRWQLCSRRDSIRSMCSNAPYTDLTATTTIDDTTLSEWSAGNKLCLKNGRHPSFERSITNTAFGDSQAQYYWTGIFRANILIKLSVKDLFSRFSTDSPVFVNRSSMILWVANNEDTKPALCVKGTESTSRPQETSKYTTEGTPYSTKSTYSETSVFLTKITTPDDTTTVGFITGVYTTQMYTILATDHAFPTSNDGRSPALGIGIGVSVGILFLVGGAVIIVVINRRGIVHCNRKTGNNKPLKNETGFKEYMTYGKNIEDNVSDHNYFIIEKCDEVMNDHVEHNKKPNETNKEEDYNTILETEGPYEHMEAESCDYDHTPNALTSGSDAIKPENVYNKLKIDRPGDNGKEQRHGLVKGLEDDYDTTSAVLTHGKDDDSDYNHIPRTAYKADATGDAIKGDKGGDYDAIHCMKFKVAQSDASDYAHVSKDRIK